MLKSVTWNCPIKMSKMSSLTLGEASEKVSRNSVFKAPDGPEVNFEELWQDKKCVIIFLRRFG